MHPVSCTNTHHDVTDLLNRGIAKNTKTWISWEWNITFLRNKKILNLCLSQRILRSYRFVSEVTFRSYNLLFIHPNITFFLFPLMLIDVAFGSEFVNIIAHIFVHEKCELGKIAHVTFFTPLLFFSCFWSMPFENYWKGR